VSQASRVVSIPRGRQIVPTTNAICRGKSARFKYNKNRSVESLANSPYLSMPAKPIDRNPVEEKNDIESQEKCK
jgi:hypothetical protein